MITFVPVTDTELARELCLGGILLWKHWYYGCYEVAEECGLTHSQFPIYRDVKETQPMFYIQVED